MRLFKSIRYPLNIALLHFHPHPPSHYPVLPSPLLAGDPSCCTRDLQIREKIFQRSWDLASLFSLHCLHFWLAYCGDLSNSMHESCLWTQKFIIKKQLPVTTRKYYTFLCSGNELYIIYSCYDGELFRWS